MIPQNWQNVQIEKPKGYRSFAETIPLSALYDSGYFISALFGTEAWVVNKKTFYAQPLRILSDAPAVLSKGMVTYSEKQYSRFLAKIQRLHNSFRLLENHQQFR